MVSLLSYSPEILARKNIELVINQLLYDTPYNARYEQKINVRNTLIYCS